MLRSFFGFGSEAATAAAEGRVKQIDAAALQARLDQSERLFLLDVRSAQEYAYDGHISGSHLLPLPMLLERIHELPHDMAIICICRSGNRSQTAAEQLLAAGFSDLTNLAGGVRSWRAHGFPYE